MEEKRKLTSNDKIPGCERLTRPEEIKSLSKYLGAIRETQEEWISNNMPSESDQMVGREPDIELSKDSLRLERKEEEINLPESNVLLEVKNKVNSLNDGSEKLNLTAEEPGLSKGAEKLSVPDIGSLRAGLENLEVPDIKGLREGIEKINPSEVDNLKDKLIRLKAEGDLKTLPDKKEGLTDNRQEKLNPILENLHVKEVDKLDSTREGLRVSDINDLATKSERLKNISDPDKLSTVKEGLNVSDIKELNEIKQTLKTDEVESLSESQLATKSERLKNISDPDKLSTAKEGLNVSDVKELSETKQTLAIDDVESLSESQIILTPNNEPQKLSDFLDSLSIDEADSLPDAVVIPAGDPKDVIDLKEDIVKLGIPKSALSDLPKGKETLTDNREESLRPGKEGLSVSDNINGLKNDSIGLEVEETNTLNDQREGLEVNDPANKLGDSKETLKVEETKSLRGKKESLKVTDKVSSLPAEAKELEAKDSAVPGNKRVNPTVDFDFLSNPHIPNTKDETIRPDVDFDTLAFGKDYEKPASELYNNLDKSLGKKRADPIGVDAHLGAFEGNSGEKSDLASILSDYLRGKIDSNEARSDIRKLREDGIIKSDINFNTLSFDHSQMSADDLYNLVVDTITKDGKPRHAASTGEAAKLGAVDRDHTSQYNSGRIELASILSDYLKKKIDSYEAGSAIKKLRDEGIIKSDINFNTLSFDHSQMSADDLYNLVVDTITKDGNPRHATSTGQAEKLGAVDRDHTSQYNSGRIELAGILSAYLSGPEVDTALAASKILEFFQKQALVNQAANMPGSVTPKTDNKINQRGPDRVGYKLPDNGFTIDQNRYIRNLAEMAADATAKNDSQGRKFILDSTLMALITARRIEETALGVNRDRLPGSEEGIVGVLQNAAGAVLNGQVQSTIEIAKRGTLDSVAKVADAAFNVLGADGIRNRPTRDDDGKVIMGRSRSEDIYKNTYNASDPVAEVEKAQLKGIINNIVGPVAATVDKYANKVNNLVDKLKGNNGFKGDDLYGIGLTLHDLCGTSADQVGTVEQLYDKLTKSPYITSAQRVILDKNRPKMTLDSNAYWEVILEPLCPGSGYQEDVDKSVNGGWSFLPSIFEINCENKVEHGVNTKYSNWVPINGIELSKSRLTSKTTGLYDGEISFPVSVEFTNELRLTVVDDQYKSWRRYFQKCTDVSVYNSEGHTSEWYKQYRASGDFMQRPTAIDKTKFCAAFYKNVAFRIRIYFMTPQYSTIKKYDLLCVLKDFSEEYTGDIEGGGIDLNVSFSIVGEDPGNSDLIYSESLSGWNTIALNQ